MLRRKGVMKIKGNGSMEKRGASSWRFRFNLGKDPLSGKYRFTPWRTFRGNKTSATRAMEEYRREIESGLRVDLQNITFAEYAQIFVDTRKNMETFSRGTLSRDRSLIRYINQYLGQFALWDIDSLLLKDVYAKMVQQDGITTGKLHDVMAKTKQVLRSAADDDIIIRNPADKFRIPQKPRPNRRSLSKFEAGNLLSVLERSGLNRNTLAVRIGLATGMRKGEVLGLRWQDIDLIGNCIHVNHALDSNKKLKEPKTTTSIRKLSIDDDTASRIHAWKVQQAASLAEQGILQNSDTYVCGNHMGGPCEPNRFYRWFQEFCVDNGFAVFMDEDNVVLPRRRFNENGFPVDENGRPYSRSNRSPMVKRHYQGLKFHELRHTHATLLITNKVDIKTVQDRLGHAKAAMTLDFYAHSSEEQDRAASDLFSSLLVASSAAGLAAGPPERRAGVVA
jgi:integrase